jgi:hypothetical protein
MAGVRQNQASNATSLGTTAAIVGQGGDVSDQGDFKTGNLKGTDGSFTARTRPTDQNLNLAHTLLKGATTSGLSSRLGSKRGALSSALEAAGTG